MKSYYTAELNKLNETGRPFNRPLMWDFPVSAPLRCCLCARPKTQETHTRPPLLPATPATG